MATKRQEEEMTDLTRITDEVVDKAKGAELRMLWQLVHGRSTSSEHASRLRAEIRKTLVEKRGANGEVESVDVKRRVRPAKLDEDAFAAARRAVRGEDLEEVDKSAKAEVDKPAKAEVDKPAKAKADKPKVAKADKPKAAKADKPKAAKVDKPKAAKIDKPKAAKIDKPKAAKVDKAEVTSVTRKLADRAAANKLAAGAILEHTRDGEVLAKCTYLSPREWRYKGKVYTSGSAAANACAEDIGMESRTLNGWWFWKVEKRAAIGEG